MAWVIREASAMPADEIVIVNLSGRGDKDIMTIAKLRGIEL